MIQGAKILLLDGATGTELDRRGVDIRLPLWSARALLEAPDVLAEIHRDYLEAGAGLITANTFRTHRRSLAKAGLGDQAPALTRRAVEIARQACDPHEAGVLVVGSVAPLEDCYRPDLAPEVAACRLEHAEMIECLLEAGVDLILIETMNNLAEAGAAADAARRLAPGKWMISLCVKPQGPPGVLLSGEAVTPLLEQLHDARAVGVNCVAAPHVEAQVQFLREALPDGVQIMAYANVGHADETGNWVITDAVDPQTYAGYAQRWVEAGATMVGGCCGTTPETIKRMGTDLFSGGKVPQHRPPGVGK